MIPEILTTSARIPPVWHPSMQAQAPRTPAIFPSRPSRGISILNRELTSWTSRVPDPSRREWRDWPVENPWIPAGILGPEDYPDERHWLAMERDPAIKGAMNTRIAHLLGGGVRLERGEGDGAEELFDFWSWALPELPMMTIYAIALRSKFRGWECFETRGAWREWEGKRVYVPAVLYDGLTWQFRWTVGRDLAHMPGGAINALYRMQTLPAQMKWWTPRCGGLSNPYGEPMHGYYCILDYAARQLSESGLVQIGQAQGFLKVAHTLGLDGEMTSQDEAISRAAIAKLKNILAELRASGILWVPEGWDVSWEALTAAVAEWRDLFRYFGDEARSYYSGGNLTSQVSGSTGSRAIGEVQERQALRLAQLDAQELAFSIRSWMRAWSAWNAETLSSSFRAQGLTPSLLDVPMAAVPRLVFRGLNRLRKEQIDFVLAMSKIGVEGDLSTDAAELFDRAEIPLLDEDQDGPTLDLAKQVPPPSPFGAQKLPFGDRRGQPPAPVEEDEQAN